MIKKNSLLRIIAFLCCSVFLISVGTPIMATTEQELHFPSVSGASEVYLYNYESDSVIIHETTGKKIAPASTVKIMTGLLAIEMLGDRLDENVTVTSDMLRGVEGYCVGLEVGDVLKINDLIYGLLCGGGNDAAILLSVICCGSVEAFVEKMNEKAKSWGCEDTYYVNPTGIDDATMTTSLKDTVIISQKAVKSSLFIEASSAPTYSFKFFDGTEMIFRNRNALINNHSAIGYQNSKVKGLNAGMTDKGGYCVSAYATDGDSAYLCVVMGGSQLSSGKISSYTIANSLLNHAFDNYQYAKICEKGYIVDKMNVDFALPTNGNDIVTVPCVISEDIYAYAPSNINFKTDLTYKVYLFDRTLKAPVKAGITVGAVDVFYEDIYLGSSPLVTQTDIVESQLLLAINTMKSFFTSRPVLLSVVMIIILIVTCYVLFLIKKKPRSIPRIK